MAENRITRIDCPECANINLVDITHSKRAHNCSLCGVKMTIEKADLKVARNQALPPVLAGDFEILDKIGAGGMGAVFKARQISQDRIVAVKILLPRFNLEEKVVQRFYRESDTLASLDHPGIVKAIARGKEGGFLYFVMEFVEGKDLSALLMKKNLSFEANAQIVRRICKALYYAHQKGVIHRDIKPANILISSKGKIKITDFGLARILRDQNTQSAVGLTATHMVMGTWQYMAPEQKESTKNVDHRADIYSTGVMIYEMYTGKEPQGSFPRPSEVDPSLPKELDLIVEKALRPDPAERFEQIIEISDLLKVAIKRVRGELPPEKKSKKKSQREKKQSLKTSHKLKKKSPKSKYIESEPTHIPGEKKGRNRWGLVVLVIVVLALIAWVVVTQL